MMQAVPLSGHPAILKAERLVGSERKLAIALHMSRSHLYAMRLGKWPVPAEIAIKIEEVTNKKVRRKELRPDLW